MQVALYTKDGCSFCRMATWLLSRSSIPYKEYHLDRDFTKEWLKESYPSATTFPVVIVDGFMIGGYTELQEMIAQEDKRNFLQE